MGRLGEAAKVRVSQGAQPPPLAPALEKFAKRKKAETLSLAESEARRTERALQKRARQILDEDELERLKGLLLFAQTTVDGHFQGTHRSAVSGDTGDFQEFKAYIPGMPISALDWKVYGKTKRLVVKQFRLETDMAVHLLVDASRSMAFSGDKREVKGLHAAKIAAALAYLNFRQGDKTSLTLYAEEILEHLPAGSTRRHLLEMARALTKPAFEPQSGTDLFATLESAQALLKTKGRLIIVSDFLGEPAEKIFGSLSAYRHRGFEILLIKVQDPQEASLPDLAFAHFVDMETAEQLEIEPLEFRTAYAQQVQKRERAFDEAATKHGIEVLKISTAKSYAETLGTYFTVQRTGR